jgi:hypothetical protein
MTTYLFASIWIVSNVVCMAIARHRNVKVTTLSTMMLSLLGPLAVPLVLAAKPAYARQSRQSS